MIGISRAPAGNDQGHSERVEMLLSMLDGSQGTSPQTQSFIPHGGFPSANVLCDLADALRDLDRGDRRRVTVRVRLGDEPCEIGLERSGTHVLLSLYSGGALPVVHVFERPLSGVELAQRVAAELAEREQRGGAREAERVAAARASLSACVFGSIATTPVEASDHYAAFRNTLQAKPWCISCEFKQDRGAQEKGGTEEEAIIVDGLSIHVDVTKYFVNRS